MSQTRILYADDKQICQVVNWPPRNAERGWEMDIICEPRALGLFQDFWRCVFHVDDVEFTGLERILLPGIIMPEDEMAKVTLVFQHCVTAEADEAQPIYTFGLTHRIVLASG